MARPSKISYDRALELHRMVDEHGKPLTIEALAKIEGVTRQTMSKTLDRLKPEDTQVKLWTDLEGELPDKVATILDRLLVRMANPAKIDAMTGAQMAKTFGIMFDKMRLLRGQSTMNIHNVIQKFDPADLEALKKEIRNNRDQIVNTALETEINEEDRY